MEDENKENLNIVTLIKNFPVFMLYQVFLWVDNVLFFRHRYAFVFLLALDHLVNIVEITQEDLDLYIAHGGFSAVHSSSEQDDDDGHQALEREFIVRFRRHESPHVLFNEICHLVDGCLVWGLPSGSGWSSGVAEEFSCTGCTSRKFPEGGD